MIKSFPEIDEFFSKDSFSNIQLSEFLEKLKKGKTKVVKQNIDSYLALKLVQFELQSSENYTNRQEPNESSNKTIENIAKEIRVSERLLISMVVQKTGESVNAQDEIPDRLYKVIAPFINNKKKLLKSERKRLRFNNGKSIKRAVSYSPSDSESVFDLAHKLGGLNKVIYIRRK